MKSLIKQRLQESMNFELIENMLDEEYPVTFDMAHFKLLRSFRERVRYCEDNLQRISSGSSRIVYRIDNEKVLKLAKNEKGLGQNAVEIQWGRDSYFENILAHTYDFHQDDLWVEMELARKVTKPKFKELTGVNLNDLAIYLSNSYRENNGRRALYSQPDNIKNELIENEFSQNLNDFMIQTDSVDGDFSKLSTYGIVKRNGHESLVIIDFGLTSDVYATYYS